MEICLTSMIDHYDDIVLQYNRRHLVGFIRVLYHIGSVGLVETIVEYICVSSVDKKTDMQRIIIDTRVANDIFEFHFRSVTRRDGV